MWATILLYKNSSLFQMLLEIQLKEQRPVKLQSFALSMRAFLSFWPFQSRRRFNFFFTKPKKVFVGTWKKIDALFFR
jgi:hypothetical protein